MDALNSVQLPIPFSTWINKRSEASENTDQGFTENKTKPHNKTKNPKTPNTPSQKGPQRPKPTIRTKPYIFVPDLCVTEFSSTNSDLYILLHSIPNFPQYHLYFLFSFTIKLNKTP